MIIPIRTPFTRLPRHPSYPTPTHICWILLCWRRSFDLGNMLCLPGCRWVPTIRSGSAAGQPCPPGGECVKGETCNFISTAISSWLPAITPREEISLGPPSGIFPFCFGWESHLCPRTVRNGILPGNGTYRQLPGSWTRTTISQALFSSP